MAIRRIEEIEVKLEGYLPFRVPCQAWEAAQYLYAMRDHYLPAREMGRHFKVDAIKLLRMSFKLSLKDAKLLYDAAEQENRNKEKGCLPD